MSEPLMQLSKRLFRAGYVGVSFAWFVPIVLAALCMRIGRLASRAMAVAPSAPRLLWAGVPIRGLGDTSRALEAAGFRSVSIATARFQINNGDEFDRWLSQEEAQRSGWHALAYLFRASAEFIRQIFAADILHAYFNGGVLGRTPIARWEFSIWKLAGGRLILSPYGNDAFVYSRFPDQPWAHAIRKTYPRTEEEDEAVRKRVDEFTPKADCVVGCISHTVGLPRVDSWPVLWYPAPRVCKAAEARPFSTEGPIRIVHAPNHRTIKGTDALLAAVETLKASGHEIDFQILERVPNDEVIRAFADADIVVDQLLFGYALTALEAMAMGRVVITAVDRFADEHRPFLERSYLEHLPAIPSDEATILMTLEGLIARRKEWPEIGAASRRYVEMYHSEQAAVELYSGIYEALGFTAR